MELMSEKYDLVVESIFTMQGEALKSSKDSVNPHFKSRYSDLTSVMEALREPMQKAGLCVVQSTRIVDGEMVLRTMLMHKSGQWVGSDYPIRPKDPSNPQAVGGAITYARRFALSALTGLVQADDDGNEASKPKPPEKKPDIEDRLVTGEEIDKMLTAIGSDEKMYNSIKDWAKKDSGIDDLKHMKLSAYVKVMKRLEANNATA